jgi:hypothetical protein
MILLRLTERFGTTTYWDMIELIVWRSSMHPKQHTTLKQSKKKKEPSIVQPSF